MIKIQPEKGEYDTAIHEINVLGFGLENEARLVENLRKSPDFIPELSLVAVKDKMVVGHILFSRIAIQTKTGSFPAMSLAPMAVHPPTQETTPLAVEECVTPDRNPFSDGSAMLRRISLTGG